MSQEEGKIRVFEMIPKYEFARTDSSQSDVKSLSNRSNDIHNNCISNGLAETDVDDDKKHEGSEKHKPSELNLIENGCDSIANENSNQKQSAIELLRNCLTENGNRYLTNKVQQLLEDNERLQKYKKGLETRLIESKLKQVQLKVKPNKSINGGSCVNETSDNFNQSSQINGRITATESKGTTNGLKNPIVIAPKVRENGLIRSNRHTINLPNKRFVGKSMQRRKEAPDFYEIFGNHHQQSLKYIHRIK